MAFRDRQALRLLVPGCAGDPHVPVYEVRQHAGIAELHDLGIGALPDCPWAWRLLVRIYP